jgi:hypothetical protein
MKSMVEDRWLEARERLRPYVDAVFWQELEVPSPEREEYVDWILDKIFKSEYKAAISDNWSVWCQDNQGIRSILENNLSYDDAKAMARELNMNRNGSKHWHQPGIFT